MLKKYLAYTLIFLLIIGLSSYTLALKKQPMIEYKTLKGTLYEEGTGEISLLILKTENDKKYLVKGDLKKVLRNLKGIPLILTGKVDKTNGNYFQGKFTVEMYNTDYPKYIYYLEEVSVLGRLKNIDDILLIITPDQQVIELNGLAKETLQKNIGKKVLINGSLTRTGEYQAQMEIKSYLVLE
ncbi:hypothetical protein BBF96_13020 [Anoxybacter fermentans]|uniref:Uncharacterized protein n=1 Tax=Anoxybacter fermentans TaxID=1323375 RepID=A0A3Q9HRP9_9FIRM|nr:hypothetical protein [Anoxybacter fermentans]AZR74238.1 hypothetical protein BBF96_13020 [Anoxybacter fermentans]